MKKLFLLPLLLALCGCANLKNSTAMKPGQTAQKFYLERKQVLSANYLLFLPDGYGADAAKHWPLILFLHGAGERGSNIWLVAKHGPPKIDTTETNFPFIVVSPQCPEGKIWSNDLLLALLDEIETKYAVDTHRVYLTGLSMGGFGTWSLGLSHPEKFAAIAPICGGGEIITPLLADKAKLASLPVWAFHGAKDPTVPVEESEHMVNYLKKIGVKEVKFTVYPDALHDSWTQTYANPELFAWFLQHSR
jgi:predicted peptidase